HQHLIKNQRLAHQVLLKLGLVLTLTWSLILPSLSLKVGESLRAELSVARAKRATCCGAKRSSGVLLLTKYRIIATSASRSLFKLLDVIGIAASGRSLVQMVREGVFIG